MSGAALVQFAKSLSPRFNLHFSFCSRSKKQTEPNDRNERGEAPRHPEDDSERGRRAEGVPHSLSPDSPSASSNSSTRSSSQSDQPSPLNQLHSNAINSPVAACLNTGVALCRSDSSASSSSSTSTIWVPSPWDGQMHSAAPACSYPPGQQALVPLPPSSQPFPADSQIAGTHVDRSPTPAPSAFDTDCSCPICLDPISNADLEPLTGCEHILHTHCLRDLLLHAQADCLLPARCPVPACRSDILDPDIRRVLAPPAYSSYRTAEWRYYVDSHPAEFVRCPTANCSYVFAWNEAEYMAGPHSALCPECQHAYCLRCRCNWHPRASCEESGGRAQDWQRTERVLSGLGFRRCRQCRHWVEKSSGCNKITCRCGYRFCHKCGSENAKCNCSSIFHVFYPHYMVLSNWK